MAAGVGLAAVAMFPPSFLSDLPGWSRQSPNIYQQISEIPRNPMRLYETENPEN
jgi:hypothetical protein